MNMNECILNRLQKIGYAQRILESTLKNDLFEDLSKHNPYWHSQNSEDGEKLYDIRVNLKGVEEDIFEAIEALRKREEEFDEKIYE